MINSNGENLKGAQRKLEELDSIFAPFSDELKRAGALSVKVKQFISLGIAVTKGCEVCIRGHVLQALEAGASGEEVMEACFMAVQMDGGPSLAHAKELVMKAVEDYERGERFQG